MVYWYMVLKKIHQDFIVYFLKEIFSLSFNVLNKLEYYNKSHNTSWLIDIDDLMDLKELCHEIQIN